MVIAVEAEPARMPVIGLGLHLDPGRGQSRLAYPVAVVARLQRKRALPAARCLFGSGSARTDKGRALVDVDGFPAREADRAGIAAQVSVIEDLADAAVAEVVPGENRVPACIAGEGACRIVGENGPERDGPTDHILDGVGRESGASSSIPRRATRLAPRSLPRNEVCG